MNRSSFWRPVFFVFSLPNHKSFHMKIHKLIIATVLGSLGIFSSSFAQSPSNGKAVGLRTSNFNNLNLTFSIIKNENKALRFRAGGFNYNYTIDNQNSTGGLRLAVGFQRFKVINEKFSFHHGFEPAINFSFLAANGIQNSNTSLRLGYMIGFNYTICPNFNIYVETIPALYINNTYINSTPSNSFTSFGINANSQLLGIGAAYNF